jgi:hypothetical protein
MRLRTLLTIAIKTIDNNVVTTEMTETMMIMVDGTEMTQTDVTTTSADAAMGHLVADLRADPRVDPETMGETQADVDYDANRVDPVTLIRRGQIAVAVRRKQQ